ncbi:MAG: hypothetical protein KAX05_00150 [Bacteroidales bacterium]|nr:hypothetical protein [Bacteroidales bacterium]
MTELFHYSSINKLALILDSKKIRFNRLDLVNDPNEGISKDFGAMAMYMFVSCWTKNSEENFALWNMYTDKMRGIRIELPTPVFNSYKIGDYSDFIITKNDSLNDQKRIFILPAENKPVLVEYTDDEDRLFPKIRTDIGLKTSALGLRKRTIWKIEDEVRYKMEIYPFDPNVSIENFPVAYEKFIDKRIPPSIEFYDVDLNIESLKEMKIVIGPKCVLGDRQIVEALISKYNPTAEIFESKLSGKIK